MFDRGQRAGELEAFGREWKVCQPKSRDSDATGELPEKVSWKKRHVKSDSPWYLWHIVKAR